MCVKKRFLVLISIFDNTAIIEITYEKQQRSHISNINFTIAVRVDEIDKKANMYPLSKEKVKWPSTVFVRLLVCSIFTVITTRVRIRLNSKKSIKTQIFTRFGISNE